MPLIGPILKLALLVLQPWAAQNNAGTAVIASSIEELWTQAFNTTDRPSVIIAYGGDEPRGPFETSAATHRGDFTIKIAVIKGRVPTADRGQGLVETVGNARPYYDLFEEARDLIRAVTNMSVEQFIDYKGSEPMNERPDQSGNRVDGYLLTFSCAQDYPQLVSTPDNQNLPQ